MECENKIIIAIVANKADLEKYREVQSENGQTYAEQNDCFFMETSAKKAINIDHLWKLMDLTRKLNAKTRDYSYNPVEKIPVKEYFSKFFNFR